jgi:Cu/Ag efflux protein CusF
MKNMIPLLVALAFVPPSQAQPVAAPAAEVPKMAEGTVRKLDPANGKLTLRHGPIANLDMPAMTMVFRVQPPDLMNGLRVGDSVRFHAELEGGVYTVTRIERQP